MALSPEDVIKKSFKPTHLKRGYDETEVDDFLDEIVVELRRLSSDNVSLRTDLDACLAGQGGVGGADTVLAPTGNPDVDAEQEQLARVRRERDELVAELDQLSRQVEQRRAEAGSGQAIEAVDERLDADATDRTATDPVADSTSIIALAHRVHDEHVAQGESIRARLVSEAEGYRDRVVGAADQRSAELIATGQQRHDELVTQGQLSHDELVREAEARRTQVLDELTAQQASLSETIEELTFFESEYRNKLRGFLAEQLDRLDQDELQDDQGRPEGFLPGADRPEGPVDSQQDESGGPGQQSDPEEGPRQ